MYDCVEEMYLTVLKSDGTEERRNVPLIKEHNLSINIDGVEAMSLVCTDERLRELVVGRLLIDGYISGIEDIEKISFDIAGERAEVVLKGDSASKESAVKSISSKEIEEKRLKLKPDIDEVFQLAKVFSEGMPIHSRTQGTHSCLLAQHGTIIFSCEDIGRHNTVDKAVGYAMLNNKNLSKCILYISGRVPVDMMQKIIKADIPVLVTKAVPTADAVKMAKEYGITLIVKAYPDQIEICD
jgi:Uncharacterized protein required for formate dehydrogenase activity